MATIYEAPAAKSSNRWLGQVQWPNGMDRNILETSANRIQDSLIENNCDVKYYHAESGGPEKLTSYEIEDKSEVAYPERLSDIWNKAVGEIKDATSNFLVPDQEIGGGN